VVKIIELRQTQLKIQKIEHCITNHRFDTLTQMQFTMQDAIHYFTTSTFITKKTSSGRPEMQVWNHFNKTVSSSRGHYALYHSQIASCVTNCILRHELRLRQCVSH
jgi:hypothetical protein